MCAARVDYYTQSYIVHACVCVFMGLRVCIGVCVQVQFNVNFEG